jgi:hypothetical protein
LACGCDDHRQPCCRGGGTKSLRTEASASRRQLNGVEERAERSTLKRLADMHALLHSGGVGTTTHAHSEGRQGGRPVFEVKGFGVRERAGS